MWKSTQHIVLFYSHPIAGILPIYKNEGVTVRLLSYNEIYIKDCNLVRVPITFANVSSKLLEVIIHTAAGA